MRKPEKSVPTRRYDTNYGHFESDLYTKIRREAYGEDIGQNSCLTAKEHDKFLEWLELSAGKKLLDVACGAGGPAIRAAERSGCEISGVDIHEAAIAAANSLAAARELAQRCKFQVANAAEGLSSAGTTFDAIVCIDAINHIPDRPRVFSEWARVLKPRGRVLFTDPITVTGPLTDSEIRIRSSSGFYLFVPEGYDEQVIAASGLRLLRKEDVTRNMEEVAERRRAARAAREKELRAAEGDLSYEEQQEFLTVTGATAREKRLSRFVYLAETTG